MGAERPAAKAGPLCPRKENNMLFKLPKLPKAPGLDHIQTFKKIRTDLLAVIISKPNKRVKPESRPNLDLMKIDPNAANHTELLGSQFWPSELFDFEEKYFLKNFKKLKFK